MRLNVTLVALVAIAALIAAGCGGSGDGGSSDSTSADGTNSSQASNTQNASGDAVAGDGGGAAAGDGSSSEVLSKAEFIKQGDAICQKGGGRIFNELQRHKTEYGRGWGRQPSKKQNEEGLVDLVLPILREEVEELEALTPPPGDEAEIEAMLDAFEEGVEKTEAKPGLAESRGPNNPLAEASALSQKYGFKVCGA